MLLQNNIEENIKNFEETFENCGDYVSRKLPVTTDRSIMIYAAYIDMLADGSFVSDSILSPLMLQIRQSPPDLGKIRTNIFDALVDGGVSASEIEEAEDINKCTTAIMSGDTVLLIGNFAKALIISTKGFPTRGVTATETEVVVQGSKEAFSESMRINTALIRRRIRDTNLKMQQLKIGRRSQTDIAVSYISDIVRPKILEEILYRLNNIDIDAILDSGYIQQLIEEDHVSPFPQMQLTERPDKVAAAILEGRVAIVVDNSPFVLIAPATFATFFQSSEDYYERWQIMSFVRLIRYLAAAFAAALPGLYIATSVYHPSMISMFLVFKMAGARQAVPLPGVLEILIMDLAFELLREAGIRLPGPIGGTIGIVGGIIVGQAAVEAGLVSPIVVIIVALTGISSFAIPSIALVAGFRLVKYIILGFSACLGLFGFWISVLLIIIHMASLKSFGIPYMFPYSSADLNDFSDLKDSVIRPPLFLMKKRPFFAHPSQRIRMSETEKGNINDKE